MCRDFGYFGASAALLPDEFMSLVKKGPGHKHNQGNLGMPKFLSWLKTQRAGLIGQPSSIKAVSGLVLPSNYDVKKDVCQNTTYTR